MFLAGYGAYSSGKSEGKGQHSTPLHLVNTYATGAFLTLLHIVLRITSDHFIKGHIYGPGVLSLPPLGNYPDCGWSLVS